LIQTLDAIQAHRPFYSDLFMLYMKTYHTEWTLAAQMLWNENFKKFDVPLNHRRD
jgi:hypothetical protein